MKKSILAGLIVGAIILAGCAASEKSENFTYKVGQFEVITLVETERERNPEILVGADEEALNRYIPDGVFTHTANAFLVKAAGQNILIDAGTGVDGIIVEKIKALGIQPEDINTILITHLHGDHFGGLQLNDEAAFPNAAIYISENDLEYFTVTNVNQRAVDVLALYETKIITFSPVELSAEEKPELLAGITPIAAYGHTPGHTVFEIENSGAKMLIIGDLLHVALIQFAIPEISATFDIDPIAAAATRRQFLSYVAENKIPIGGMHIINPGAGTVETDDEGFKFTPFNFQ